MNATNRTGVSTTDRSLEIVEYLKQEDDATMRELTAAFDLSKSTVHKHLTTLMDHGYVTKRGEEYRLGLAFFNKGQYVKSRRAYFEVADEIIRELDAELEEDIEFVVENAGKGILAKKSTHKRNKYEEGEALPEGGTYYHLHSMAAGKVILANLPEERVHEIVEKWGLPAYTEATITDPDELFAELRRIRARGYALSDEEFTTGMRAVSCCVHGLSGEALGALAVCAPIYRMHGDEFTEELPKRVATYVDRFEERLREANQL